MVSDARRRARRRFLAMMRAEGRSSEATGRADDPENRPKTQNQPSGRTAAGRSADWAGEGRGWMRQGCLPFAQGDARLLDRSLVRLAAGAPWSWAFVPLCRAARRA